MNFTPEQIADIVDVAHALADAARAAALPHFRSAGLVASNKDSESGFDPVTVADRAAERAMREVLARRRPEDAILGEEEDDTPGTSGLTWVLDPIDGTRAFISGLPLWGTLIALDTGHGPIFGMIEQPYIGERFVGGFGFSELSHGGSIRPLATRPCASLSEATLTTTFPEVGTAEEGAAFRAVSQFARLTRYGGDCYAYAMIAAGQIDLVIEAGLKPFDIQGPQAVVEAAGGIVSDWSGGPAHRGGRVIAAGDRRVHAEALEILSKVP